MIKSFAEAEIRVVQWMYRKLIVDQSRQMKLGLDKIEILVDTEV